MKKFLMGVLMMCCVFCVAETLVNAVLIIDHKAVDDFDNIPDEYLNAVKSMRVQYIGQSHGRQVPHGLELLEAMDPVKYSVQIDYNLNNLTEAGALKVLTGYRTQYNSWQWGSGEEGYWATETGRARAEYTVQYANSIGMPLGLSVWCWCWDITNENYCNDESGTLITFNDERRDAYLGAINRFNTNFPQTLFLYHTSITDTGADSRGWRVTHYNDDIRQAAIAADGILFDQADIENWNIDNTGQRIDTWDGHTLRIRHTDYREDDSIGNPDGIPDYHDGHTNDALCIRKAKALWVLLAKLSGWGETTYGEKYYVRPNGGIYGNEDGSGWNNAFDGLPAKNSGLWGESAGQIGIGDTVYVAGGLYTTDWEPGTGGLAGLPVTIKRATVSDHGFDAGWNDNYDAQIVIDGHSIIIGGENEADGYDYITIDGRVWNGIRIDKMDGEAGHMIQLSPSNRYPSNDITIRYVECEGAGINQGIDNTQCFHDAPSGEVLEHPEHSNITVQHCHFHHTSDALMRLDNCGNFLMEHCQVHDNQDDSLHEDFIITYNAGGIMRYNTCWNTGSEGLYFEEGSANWDVYGNVLYQIGAFYGFGKGISSRSDNNVQPASGIRIYNNTVIGFNIGIRFEHENDSGFVNNNLLFGNNAQIVLGPQMQHNFNWYSGGSVYSEPNGVLGSSENPFADSVNNDYHLAQGASPVNKGTDLGDTYNTDMDGNTRGHSGVWDMGAYEYTGAEPPPLPENYCCVRPASECTGDDSGRDWNNAKPVHFEYTEEQWRTLFWNRDTIYYVADGEYNGLMLFNAQTDGEKFVVWRKATVGDHSTNVGWNNDLGDGQAVFRNQTGPTDPVWWVLTDCWILDGAVGYGGDKNDYGFYIVRDDCTGFTRSDLISIGSWGTGNPCHVDLRHLAFTNCDCGGELQDWDITQNCVYGAPQTEKLVDVNITSCFMEKAQTNLLMYKWDDSIIEYCYFSDNWSTGAPNDNHGQQVSPDDTKNIVFRYNTLHNSYVGGIAYHQRSTANRNDDWRVYGNVAFNTDGRQVTMGIFGNADTGRDDVSINCKYYNNTIANIAGGNTGIRTGYPADGGPGNVAYNNLWYGCNNPVITGGTYEDATVHDYNAYYNCAGTIADEPNIQVESQDPFADSVSHNFRLNDATANGIRLPSPFNIDADGRIRGGDGVWDRGAYEYGAGVFVPGDVNYDGAVDIRDIQTCINAGEADMRKLQEIIDIILGAEQ